MFLLALCAGCSAIYKASDHQGGDAGEDGSIDTDAGCDADGDTHLSIACGGDDCDDGAASVHPGAPDVCGNGIDETCLGQTPFSMAVGRTSALTFFPPALLFSYTRPESDVGSTQFTAPLSMTSTTEGAGFFVAAGVERTGSTNRPFVVRASMDAPTTYTRIADFTSGNAPESVVGAAVRRQPTGSDIGLAYIRLRPDPAASQLSGWIGGISVEDDNIAITELDVISGLAGTLFRPGVIMTGGSVPVRWVIGEIDPSGTPRDDLSSCQERDAGSCRATASSLLGEDRLTPNQMIGTPSGHVFLRRNNGALSVWDHTNGGDQTFNASALVLGGSMVRNRPAAARLSVSGPISAGVHSYVVAVPYLDGGTVPRLALVPFSCGSSNGAPTSCTHTSGFSVMLPANEVFVGPATLIALADNRIALFSGVRSTSTLTEAHLRMFVGTFDGAGPTFTFTADLEDYNPMSTTLADVAAEFVDVNAEPATISVLWQMEGASMVVRAAGARFCNAP